MTLLPAAASAVASGSWDATLLTGIFASGARSIFTLKLFNNALASSSVNPQPGTTITAGSGVVLEIASGNVQVPSLVGLNEIGAKTVLTQAGFLIREFTAFDPSKALGEILAQAPEAGATKTIGSIVTITINKN